MNNLQKRIGVANFKGIDRAYILISAQRDPEWDINEPGGIRAHFSFLYAAPNGCAAEWEPNHGPIQLWERCDVDHPKAKEHYYYDYVVDRPMAWSQMAVDNEELRPAFVAGDYKYIFEVLKEWATR